MGIEERMLAAETAEKIEKLCRQNKREDACNVAFSYWLDKVMPLRYRQVDLMKLPPSDKNRLSPATQQWFYDEVRNNITDGFMIFGAVGTGKTTVALGYYRFWMGQEILRISQENPIHEGAFSHRVLDRSEFAVWRQTAKDLLQQHHDWAINRQTQYSDGSHDGADKPFVNMDRIQYFARKKKVTPRLVLEEIDKVGLTEARRDTLFEIIDALDADLGKFFINTNFTPEEFENQFGAQFVRRIRQSCKVIDLFKKEK